MKAHIMENQPPKNAEEAARIVENIYKPIIMEQVSNAFVMGGKAAFKILYETFIKDILSDDISEDRKKEILNGLVEYIKKEYKTSENSKEKAKGEIENAAEHLE